MRKQRRTRPPAPLAYQLPEESYSALIQARDQLVLMACLSASRSRGESRALSLSPDALAHCFHRFADELNEIVQAAWWPVGASSERDGSA